jgi:hypothetical protein
MTPLCFGSQKLFFRWFQKDAEVARLACAARPLGVKARDFLPAECNPRKRRGKRFAGSGDCAEG